VKINNSDIIIVNIEDIRNMASNKGFLMFCIDRKIDGNNYLPNEIVSITRSEWIRYGSNFISEK
jgi:hypothetical protein